MIPCDPGQQSCAFHPRDLPIDHILCIKIFFCLRSIWIWLQRQCLIKRIHNRFQRFLDEIVTLYLHLRRHQRIQISPRIIRQVLHPVEKPVHLCVKSSHHRYIVEITKLSPLFHLIQTFHICRQGQIMYRRDTSMMKFQIQFLIKYIDRIARVKDRIRI